MTTGSELAQTSAPDNLLPYPDQVLFLALRGADQDAVMQGIWIYEHPVNLDGVKRFHRNLYGTILSRRIEPSPLPFGRHRWVAQPFSDSNFTSYDAAIDRSQLYTWADEQTELPLDPESGPAWRLGVQPFTDGSTAISLVISHCVADGAGSMMACLQAITGSNRDLGYPPAGSRRRGAALRADLRQFRRDLPEVWRTLRHAVKVAARRRSELKRPGSAAPAASAAAAAGKTARMPSASVFVDAAAWHACAERLGGNSFSMVAGFTGRMAAQMRRTRASDGAVTLMIPVSEREDLQDTGGNVVSIAHVSFDPGPVTTDLTGPRTAIREGLKQAREVPDEMVELLPLVPLIPRRGIARIADVAFGFTTDLPVSCSNFGTLPPDLTSADGTNAEFVSFRGVDRHATVENLERRRGVMTVTSGQIGDRMTMSVISYQPGMANTQAELHDVITRTLSEFGLTGAIE